MSSPLEGIDSDDDWNEGAIVCGASAPVTPGADIAPDDDRNDVGSPAWFALADVQEDQPEALQVFRPGADGAPPPAVGITPHRATPWKSECRLKVVKEVLDVMQTVSL